MSVQLQLFHYKFGEKEVQKILGFASAIAKVVVSIGRLSLNRRSVGLTIPSVGSNWLLAVPNFVSTSSLSSYLDGERYVVIAFLVLLFEIQIVALVSRRIYQRNSAQFSVLAFLMECLTEYTN